MQSEGGVASIYADVCYPSVTVTGEAENNTPSLQEKKRNADDIHFYEWLAGLIYGDGYF